MNLQTPIGTLSTAFSLISSLFRKFSIRLFDTRASMKLLITLGNTLSGLRSKFNNANDTNALSAVKSFSFEKRT